MESVIYLDNNSTTQPDPRVIAAMTDCLSENYANPSSTHTTGRNAKAIVEKARQQLADLLNCNSSELVFTSGATEAINLALKGIAEVYQSKGQHIVTVETEHPSVIQTCKYLETIGFSVTYLPVDHDGMISEALFEESIRPDTLLACIMLANNETGVLQSIKKLSGIAHNKGILFMTDATQAVGRIPVDVLDLDVDLLCLSAHKFHGPKGVGALYINSKAKIYLCEQMHGGNQEKGLRSGTLNVPGIVGTGIAAEISLQEMTQAHIRIKELRDHLEIELLKIQGVIINGSKKKRLYNTTNLCFEGVDADQIIATLKNIMISNGSACTSEIIEPSHVLRAMGLTDEQAFSSIRFSLGRFTTKEEIDATVKGFTELLSKREYHKLDNKS